MIRVLSALVPALMIPATLCAGSLDRFAATVSDFRLPNGLRFVVAERQGGSPVVAVAMHVRAGIADDPPGKGGIARLFERLILHGSDTIGTKDWAQERAAIQVADEAWARLEAARRSSQGQPLDLQKLEFHARMAQEKAMQLSRPGFVSQVLDRNGVQLRAEVSPDALTYTFLIPATRVEVVFKLLSEWLRSPQFRYLPQELAAQEAGMNRTDVPAIETLQALVVREAFPSHPYGKGFTFAGRGQIRKPDVEQFFRTWLTPSNIVLGVAGQITSTEARRLGQDYFGKLSGSAAPAREAVVPAPLDGEKRVNESSGRGPAVAIAYWRPPASHEDSPALTILHAVLAGSGGGRLDEELVKKKKVMLGWAAQLHYPGRLHPNLFTLLATTSVPPDQAVTAIDEVIAGLQGEPPAQEELDAAKAFLRMRTLTRLETPAGAAAELARSYAEHGDWREALGEIDRVAAVTPEQVRDAAKKYLLPKNRIVAALSAARGRP